jgi:transcriptional regulator with XRE-family HTH domain
MKKASEVLRAYQFQNNFTQHQMSMFLGIAQSTYNNWVNGKLVVIPSKYYEKIATLCEIDVQLILPKNLDITKKIWKNHDIESLLNAMEFCQKYSKSLEDNLLLQKVEIEKLQKRVAELEVFTVK